MQTGLGLLYTMWTQKMVLLHWCRLGKILTNISRKTGFHKLCAPSAIIYVWYQQTGVQFLWIFLIWFTQGGELWWRRLWKNFATTVTRCTTQKQTVSKLICLLQIKLTLEGKNYNISNFKDLTQIALKTYLKQNKNRYKEYQRCSVCSGQAKEKCRQLH